MAGAAATGAKIGAWGFDLAGTDKSVKPGNDFYKYANGQWQATNTIPPDRSSWGTGSKLDSEAERDVRAIIESLKPGAARGTPEQKVGDFYRAYLDVDAIER